MKRHLYLLMLPWLSACGPSEVVTSAAIEAETKSKEIQAGKQLEEQMRKQTEDALQLGMQRLQESERSNQ